MKHFIIEVLDTAEQITPEKAFDILTFAFRGEVLNVSEFRPTQRAVDGATGFCQCDTGYPIATHPICGICGLPRH